MNPSGCMTSPQRYAEAGFPISLLCSFRFSLRLCVNPLSEYFTQRRQGNQKPPSKFPQRNEECPVVNDPVAIALPYSKVHERKKSGPKAAHPHDISTRQDAPRERHLRAHSGRQECYSYYVLLFVDFVLEFVDLAGITLS